MNTRVVRLVAIAILAVLIGGCASSAAQKTCKEIEAEHKICSALQWHEENEGPSVYNHFHSTYVESESEKEAREIRAGEAEQRDLEEPKHGH